MFRWLQHEGNLIKVKPAAEQKSNWKSHICDSGLRLANLGLLLVTDRAAGRKQKRCLTHPHFSEAALAQLDLQAQGFSGDFPGVLCESLGLRLDGGAHGGQPVTEAVCVFWTDEDKEPQVIGCALACIHSHCKAVKGDSRKHRRTARE